MSRVVWRLAKILAAIVMFLFGPVRVFGRENVPRTGAVLILANHISDADPPALGHAIPRRAHFMAKSELFQMRVIGPLIKAVGAFPVRRGTADRTAIRTAIEHLTRGDCVAMFPEGEISEDGNPLPILAGASMIIRKAGAPVICAGIRGTRRILPFSKVIPRPAFGGVSVRFGPPRTFVDEPDEVILEWIRSQLYELGGYADLAK